MKTHCNNYIWSINYNDKIDFRQKFAVSHPKVKHKIGATAQSCVLQQYIVFNTPLSYAKKTTIFQCLYLSPQVHLIRVCNKCIRNYLINRFKKNSAPIVPKLEFLSREYVR